MAMSDMGLAGTGSVEHPKSNLLDNMEKGSGGQLAPVHEDPMERGLSKKVCLTVCDDVHSGGTPAASAWGYLMCA
jgi:hypothetical protein